MTLTGLRADPQAPIVGLVRDLVGPVVWGATVAMVEAQRAHSAEVPLDQEQAEQLWASWQNLRERLDSYRTPDGTALRSADAAAGFIVGVEVRHDVVRAVLVDAVSVDVAAPRSDETPAVLARASVTLRANDVESVVNAVTRAVDEVAPAAAVADCALGVQIGGPVQGGVVDYYYKSTRGVPAGRPWEDVDLARRLRTSTGLHEVCVVNDAEAFAHYENRLGTRARCARFAVLVVRRGVGARLVDHGEVADYPMEIGTFLPSGELPLGQTPDEPRSRESIEARSGVAAIVHEVEVMLGYAVSGVSEAAELAKAPETVDKVVDAFWRAGKGLARGIAAAQAMVRPAAWIVIGAPEMVDESTVTGQAYLDGLRTYGDFLDWAGLRKATIAGHPVHDDDGPLAAIAAVVELRTAQEKGRLPTRPHA